MRAAVSCRLIFDDTSPYTAGADNEVKGSLCPGISTGEPLSLCRFQIGSTAGWTIRGGKYKLLTWPNFAVLVHAPLVAARAARLGGADEYPLPLVIEIRASIHKLEISVEEVDLPPPAGVR